MIDKEVTLDVSFNADATFSSEEPVRHLVLVLHGILDNSTWSNSLQHHQGKFEKIEITVRPVSYKMIGPLILFFGIGRKNRNKKIIDRIDYALNSNEFDRSTIICHSNGTKIFSEIVEKVSQKFDYIFLCASICHHDDDEKFRSYKNRVVNECGIRDIWPSLISSFGSKRFGNTGVVGFGNEPIIDRFYNYRHGGATTVKHFSDHIVPVLSTGKVKLSEIGPGKRSLLFPLVLRWGTFLALILAAIYWLA